MLKTRIRLDNRIYFCRQCDVSWDAMDSFPEVVIGYVEETK